MYRRFGNTPVYYFMWKNKNVAAMNLIFILGIDPEALTHHDPE